MTHAESGGEYLAVPAQVPALEAKGWTVADEATSKAKAADKAKGADDKKGES